MQRLQDRRDVLRYDASKCGDVNDSADSLSFMQQQQQKTSALGKPETRRRSIYSADSRRTDTRQTRLTANQPASQSDSTQLKAGK